MEKPSSGNRKLRQERERHNLSQAEVAEKLGVDVKTVSRWENGQFPHPSHRRLLTELFNKPGEELGFVDGGESEDPVQADEPTHSGNNLAVWHGGNTTGLAHARPAYPLVADWDRAPYSERFYGRTSEQETLTNWLLEEHCRIALIQGIGGMGKTTFATRVARAVQHNFAYVIWRTLENAPPIEQLLDSCLQFLLEQRTERPHNLDGKISLLITFLRKHRCLLFLDNIETIFEEGQQAGSYIPEHSGYGRLFTRLGESDHQSCVLLTSREVPPEIASMSGDRASVRILPLSGIKHHEGLDLLSDKSLHGEQNAWIELVNRYAGNPLALKIVAAQIQSVFDGNIDDFLRESTPPGNQLNELLASQFRRLSPPEQQVMYWLAVESEPVTRATLREDLRNNPTLDLVNTLDSLYARSLIEKPTPGYFSLQPVVRAFIIERFVACIRQEITTGTIALLGSHALLKAQARDYVRDSQQRQILSRVIQELLNELNQTELIARLKGLLPALRALPQRKAGYAAGNILNLLIHLDADLRGLDCSGLPVWQAYLQGTAMPDVDFAHADLSTSVFTDTFSSILCLAVSQDGKLLAAGTTTSELRLWQLPKMIPLFTSHEHTDGLRSVAFNPDGTMLASASEDETIRLWDVKTHQCLHVLRGHTNMVRSVAFSPDGAMLVSASEDGDARVWSVASGQCLHVLRGHTMRIRTIAFSPTGDLVATGSDDQSIRLWTCATWSCAAILREHSGPVRVVAFSPAGDLLVSGSEDTTARIWRVPSGECLHILRGHSRRVSTLALSPDRPMLASCSEDYTIRLWDLSTGQCQKVLQSHTNRIWSLAYVPGQDTLISASEDQTLRFWNISDGVCTRTLQGSTSLIKSIAFNADGHILASATEEQSVLLWDVEQGKHLQTLTGHRNRVRCVAFSPTEPLLASGSEDETIRLWQARNGQDHYQYQRLLSGHTHLVRALTFTPDGTKLLSCSYDSTVRLWDVRTGDCLQTMRGHIGPVWAVACGLSGQLVASGGEDHTVRLWDSRNGELLTTLRGHSHRVWALAFSPNGHLLASASDDATVRIWKWTTGECLQVLTGHHSWTRTVAWSPHSDLIASGSHDATVRLWDVHSGQCLHILRGHTLCVWSVAFHPAGHLVAGAGDDGRIHCWDVATGIHRNVMGQERLYERMNITHTTGLTTTQKRTLISLGAQDEPQAFDS